MSVFRKRFFACVWILLILAPVDGQPQEAESKKPADAKRLGEPLDFYGDPLPAGAIGRLGTSRFRHDGYGISALAFLPDGKTLVAGEQNSIRFWETSSGRRLGSLATGLASIQSFTLSADGKQIAVAGTLPEEGNRPWEGVVEVLDAGSGKKVQTITLDTQKGYHAAMAFTPDGKFLALLDSAGALRIEEIASGVEILRQQFPGDIAGYLAMSPDGHTMAIGSGPNTRKLFLWKWQAGEEPREQKEQGVRTRSLCFSPDGKTLAVCEDSGGAVRLLDTNSGRLIRGLTELEDTAYFFGMSFSPDGKVLATADGGNRGKNYSGRIILWDPATGKRLRELPTVGDSPGSVTISNDSRWLAAGTGGGIHVWDLHTGQEIAKDEASHRGAIAGLAVSSGLVATASDDNTARVWDIRTGQQKLKVEHGHWVRAVAMSPDGQWLATNSLDDSVGLWDARTGRQIYKLAGHGRFGGRRALVFLPDGKRFLSWGDDFYLRVWDVKTGKALVEHAIRPSGVKFAGEDADALERERFEMMASGESTFSNDGTILVLSLLNNFHVFDLATGKETQKIPGEGSYIISLAISPDKKLLLASAWGKQVATKLTDGRTRYSVEKKYPVCLWELDTGKLVRQIMLPGTGAGPVAFSPDGKLFAHASSSAPVDIRLFEVASGKEIKTIEGLPASAHRLAFSPDSKLLIAGMQDTTALIWDLSRLALK